MSVNVKLFKEILDYSGIDYRQAKLVFIVDDGTMQNFYYKSKITHEKFLKSIVLQYFVKCHLLVKLIQDKAFMMSGAILKYEKKDDNAYIGEAFLLRRFQEDGINFAKLTDFTISSEMKRAFNMNNNLPKIATAYLWQVINKFIEQFALMGPNNLKLFFYEVVDVDKIINGKQVSEIFNADLIRFFENDNEPSIEEIRLLQEKNKNEGILRNDEQRVLNNESIIKEFDIKIISGSELAKNIAEKKTKLSPKVKVLLLCVSYDEASVVDEVTDITKFLITESRSIEFFVANPESYGEARPGPDRKVWIDREHYFEVLFGGSDDEKLYPDLRRMNELGPFDIVMYVHCPIFNRANVELLGKKVSLESKQLNMITDKNSVLVIKPFLDNIPRFAILALKEMGFELVGANKHYGTIGVFMK